MTDMRDKWPNGIYGGSHSGKTWIDGGKQTDAVEIIYNRYYRGHPDRIAELELARKLDKLEREDV